MAILKTKVVSVCSPGRLLLRKIPRIKNLHTGDIINVTGLKSLKSQNQN
jgi:hypothetical protein